MKAAFETGRGVKEYIGKVCNVLHISSIICLINIHSLNHLLKFNHGMSFEELWVFVN